MPASTRLRRLFVAATAASMMILGVAPAAHAQFVGDDATTGVGGSGGDGGIAVGAAVLTCVVTALADCGGSGLADASGGPGGSVQQIDK